MTQHGPDLDRRQLGRYACMTDTLIAPRGGHPADPQAPQSAPADPKSAPADPKSAPTDPKAAHADPAAAHPAPLSWKRRILRFGVLGVVIGGLAFASAT